MPSLTVAPLEGGWMNMLPRPLGERVALTEEQLALWVWLVRQRWLYGVKVSQWPNLASENWTETFHMSHASLPHFLSLVVMETTQHKPKSLRIPAVSLKLPHRFIQQTSLLTLLILSYFLPCRNWKLKNLVLPRAHAALFTWIKIIHMPLCSALRMV